MGGGQEVTAMNSLSTFVHHGMLFVPFGYYSAFKEMSNLEEVHGGELSMFGILGRVGGLIG